jgi:hypothetical protein
MNFTSNVNPRGELGLYIPRPITLRKTISLGMPQKGLPQLINDWRKDNLSHLWRGLKTVLLAKALDMPAQYGVLYLTIKKPLIPDHLLKELLAERAANYIPGISFPQFCLQKGFRHEPFFLGLASFRVVTTAGVGYIVDAFQNSVEMEDMEFHGIGTGATAENITDTDMQTELTTEYSPDNTRATGSNTEGASANIYRTVGTNTLDGTPGAALREHGILSSATVGGGVLLDRTVFADITLSSGDSLQSTYDHTQTAGS